MQLVLRAVNDAFFDRILFPVFEMGMHSSETALDRLRPQISDERTGVLLETLLDRGAAQGTALWNLDQDLWLETVHRLLFCNWEPGDSGWFVRSEDPGYAAPWDQVLHVAMMVESPHYPYDDEARAEAIRRELVTVPAENLGLAAFFAGRWDPCPRFPAHELLTTVEGRGIYKSGELCVADWCYRPASAVAFWNRQLSTKLGRLIRREETRMAPVQLPDGKQVLGYWNGTEAEPPALPVAFSGLGTESHTWVQRIGEIAAQVRAAAAGGHGLTMIVTRSTGTFEEQYL